MKSPAVFAASTLATAALITPALLTTATWPVSAADAVAVQPTAVNPCSWWVKTSLATSNVFYPDTSAAYWTMGYSGDAVDKITLEGEYVNARYFAIQAYGADAQLFTSPAGTPSAITDYEIQPDAGSQNPWVDQANPGGTWTLTLSDTETGTNVLPLTPSAPVQPLIPGTPEDLNYLMMRVYLPTGTFNSVPLPSVTLHGVDGSQTTLEQCNKKERKALAKTKEGASLLAALSDRKNPPIPDCGNDCPPELEAVKVGSLSTPFPNATSAYVGALYTPKKGRVVVARATMPTTPSGTSPQVWTSGKDLRYWSFCNYVYAAPYPAVVVGAGDKQVVGCTADNATPMRTGVASNQVTIVLSFPADKKRIERRLAKSPATTWLPMSSRYGTTQEFLALRNMLPNPDFTESATLVGPVNDPQAAQDVMGEYYPEFGSCSARKYARFGAAACLG
ncbi:MAG: hypothetical protein WAO41_05370 [Candidatus Nanopelagicales bacterium]